MRSETCRCQYIVTHRNTKLLLLLSVISPCLNKYLLMMFFSRCVCRQRFCLFFYLCLKSLKTEQRVEHLKDWQLIIRHKSFWGRPGTPLDISTLIHMRQWYENTEKTSLKKRPIVLLHILWIIYTLWINPLDEIFYADKFMMSAWFNFIFIIKLPEMFNIIIIIV